MPFQTDSFKPIKTVKFQLQSVITGDEANRLVGENAINKIPKNNQEWRLYIFNLTYVVGSEVLAASDIKWPKYIYT